MPSPKKRVVFYSWQSDLPNNVNRSLIERALEKAVKAISADDSVLIPERIEVESDTAGVAGSPDIGQTIFSKIAASDVIVCDVSIVRKGRNGLRWCPNPNVMIEVGYALGTRGFDRVLLVMNTAYGSPEKLPFDLKQKRTIKYFAPPGSDEDRAAIRVELTSKLEAGIREILKRDELREAEAPAPPMSQAALAAVRSSASNEDAELRRFMKSVVERVALQQKEVNAARPPSFDRFQTGLNQTIPLVHEFTDVARIVAENDSQRGTQALFKGFEIFLDAFEERPPGLVYDSDSDLLKFAAHELFVVWVHFLLTNQRWARLKQIFSLTLSATFYRKRQNVPFGLVAQTVTIAAALPNPGGGRWPSPHGELLNRRYSDGKMPITFVQFVEADYFLYLLPRLKTGEEFQWSAPSCYYTKEAPDFVQRATSTSYLAGLMDVCAVRDLGEFRKAYKAHKQPTGAYSAIGFRFFPAPEMLGSDS